MPGGHIPDLGQSGATFRAAPGWGAQLPPDFNLIRRELRQLNDKTFLRELNDRLTQVMADRVVPDARRRALSQNVPHEIPGTIRAGVDRHGPYVRAGGPQAPAAGVYEGTRAGKNRRFPVYAPATTKTVRNRGRGSYVREARPRRQWKWMEQQRRPYLRPAMAAHEDDVREAAWAAVHDVLARAGLRA